MHHAGHWKINTMVIFNRTLYLSATVLVALVLTTVDADIFHCKDKFGKPIYQDTECSSSETFVEKFVNVEAYNVADFNNSGIELDGSLKTIFQGSIIGNQTRFVKVSIAEETDEYLLLEVVGYFSGSPKGKMQFRAVPNMGWAYTGDVHATERGFIKAYTRVSLKSSAEDIEESDIFSLQLWHYSPQNKATRLNMLTVPFKKTWHKKRR